MAIYDLCAKCGGNIIWLLEEANVAIYALCAKCGGVILYGCLRRPMWLFMPCVRSVVV